MEADLLVVGGGPVGLGTAIEASLAGMRVAVLEKRDGPVDKACGEGLMPAARASLNRLGVAVRGREFTGIRYRTPDREATALFRRGSGLGVRRLELSSALADRADALGVRRLPVAAGPVRVDGDRVEAGGVRARWLVAADGLHSPVRRSLGLQGATRGAPRYGLRRHFAVEPWSDLVEVHWSRDAEAYVTPVSDGVVGVAVLCPGGRSYEGWLEDFPELRDRLRGAEPAGTVRGAGPLRQRASARVRGPVLLVGDAAGYVDALTGEGLSVGLACARELVRCVVGGRPQEYERAWRRTTRRYRVLTGGLLWAAQRPAVRRTIVPAAQRAPALFGRIVDQLG